MNKILVGLVVLLVVILGGVVGLKQWFGDDTWTAMYMRTGDLYFGKLMHFPFYGLKQVYVLQVNAQNAQTPLSIQQFKRVMWGPEDWIRINRSEVVWTTELNSEGQLAQILKTNPDLAAQQQSAPQGYVPQQQAPQPAPTATGSDKGTNK